MTWALVQVAGVSGYAGFVAEPVSEPASVQSPASNDTRRLCNRSRQPA